MPADLSADFFDRLIEHPIRLQLLLAQTRAGLWVRNGFAALKPATLYRSSAFGEVFLLPDLLLLQYGLLRLGMGRFVVRAFSLFGLGYFWRKLEGSAQARQEETMPSDAMPNETLHA